MATAPSNATFLAEYPEFNGIASATITAKLAAAARRTNADVFQSTDLTTDAVMLRAAVLLLKSPAGRKMRLNNPEQLIVWEVELRDLQKSAVLGLRVF